MNYTVVGSGTALPSRERGSPCSHLEVGGRQVVLDLGSGSLRAMWGFGIDIRSIQVLLISHFHPDHTADLVPLLFALRNPQFARGGTIDIIGPEGMESYFSSLEDLYGDWLRPPGVDVRVRAAGERPVLFEEFRLSSVRNGHTADSISFRIDAGGRSFVYGGDTPYCAPLIDLARNVNLLVLECSYPEGSPGPGHLTPSQAGRMAAEAGAERLLLTHFYPGTAESDVVSPIAGIYTGDVIIAADGMSLAV